MKKKVELVPTVAEFFPATKKALRERPFSHRSERFASLFRASRERLAELSGERYASILACGSGTWANEMMVWMFAPAAKKPLVLTNGEFGNRLAAQLSACRRDAGIADFGFGNPIGEARLRKVLEENPAADLIFCVACETSWGGLTDLRMLSRVARERGITICLDAMSAVGFSPEIFSFPNIVAISASSGKGLVALPGIAVLFIDSGKEIPAAPRPRIFDVREYFAAAENDAPLNTLSSVPLNAFHASLGEILALGTGTYRRRLTEIKSRLIRCAGTFGVMPFPHSDSPMITAFRAGGNAEKFLAALGKRGFSAYTQPRYLRERGLFELAVMGDFRPQDFPERL